MKHVVSLRKNFNGCADNRCTGYDFSGHAAGNTEIFFPGKNVENNPRRFPGGNYDVYSHDRLVSRVPAVDHKRGTGVQGVSPDRAFRILVWGNVNDPHAYSMEPIRYQIVSLLFSAQIQILVQPLYLFRDALVLFPADVKGRLGQEVPVFERHDLGSVVLHDLIVDFRPYRFSSA